MISILKFRKTYSLHGIKTIFKLFPFVRRWYHEIQTLFKSNIETWKQDDNSQFVFLRKNTSWKSNEYLISLNLKSIKRRGHYVARKHFLGLHNFQFDNACRM